MADGCTQSTMLSAPSLSPRSADVSIPTGSHSRSRVTVAPSAACRRAETGEGQAYTPVRERRNVNHNDANLIEPITA